jgi:hypothetical protein
MRGKGRPVIKADNFTAICEPTVWVKCGNLNVSQTYGATRPVTGIALLLPLYNNVSIIGINILSRVGVTRDSNDGF